MAVSTSMASSGPMMSAPSIPGGGLMPMQPRAMPNLNRGPTSTGPAAARSHGAVGGDPRGASQAVDDEASFGGDACLCVEFSGSHVAAAAWDAGKKTVVALPTSDKDITAATIDVKDVDKLRAWLGKPAKARAAEIHTAGIAIGSGKEIFKNPGTLLGAVTKADADACVNPGSIFKVAVKASTADDDDDEEFGLDSIPRFSAKMNEGEVTAEALVAMLVARPRQRATQLIAKPVRRATVVCPARATQAWRRAAAEAVFFVDARAHRFISAPLAQIAGVVQRGELQPSVGDVVVSLVIDGDSFDGVVAVCEVAPIWFRVEEVLPSQEAFDACIVDDDAALVVRSDDEFTPKQQTFGGTKVRALSGDAVFGAVALQASRLELPGCVKKATTPAVPVDAVPYPIVLQRLKDNASEEDDVIFAAGTELPASIRREYAVGDYYPGKKKQPGDHEWPVLAMYERTEEANLIPCGAGIDDPFLTVDDDGRVVYATDVTVEFFVDKRGIASSQVIFARGAPKSAAKEAKERAARNCRRITAASFITFLLAPVGYTLVHMRQRAVTRKLTIAALEDFYQRAKPDKIPDCAHIADRYEGFEDVLFKRLERQYPGFTVSRPNTKHGDSGGDDSPPDDVDDLDNDDEPSSSSEL